MNKINDRLMDKINDRLMEINVQPREARKISLKLTIY